MLTLRRIQRDGLCFQFPRHKHGTRRRKLSLADAVRIVADADPERVRQMQHDCYHSDLSMGEFFEVHGQDELTEAIVLLR